MVTSFHCQNLQNDRDLGSYWERQFCLLAAKYGKSFTPMQLGKKDSIVAHSLNSGQWKSYTLPDVTIWTAPGEHHEIKHKSPFNGKSFSSYGLETYRFNALLWFAQETGQAVMYTIHNHAKAGGRDIPGNDMAHWETVNILQLNNRWQICKPGLSWVNGIKREVDIYYWSTELWTPLANLWEIRQ